MLTGALKYTVKMSRKEEKLMFLISRGVERKMHGKTKKTCSSDAKGGEEGVCPQGDHLSPDRTKKGNSANKPYHQEKSNR
jgi:hypothetical protein